MTVCHNIPWVFVLSHSCGVRQCLWTTENRWPGLWDWKQLCKYVQRALSCHCRQQVRILSLLLSRGLHRLMQDSWAHKRGRIKHFTVPTQLGPEKETSALSVIIAHLWALKVIRQVGRSVRVQNFVLCLPLLCSLPLLFFLRLLSWSVHREKRSNLSTIHWFHSACTSVSMFTISVDNRLFLCSWFLFFLCVYRGCCPLQTCNVVVVLKQRLVLFQHLRSSSLEAPSWNWGFRLGVFLKIQKYRVSVCFVRCPAPNRSPKEFAVELSLCVSIFIGIPKSWYIDLRDHPTWPPFTTA